MNYTIIDGEPYNRGVVSDLGSEYEITIIPFVPFFISEDGKELLNINDQPTTGGNVAEVGKTNVLMYTPESNENGQAAVTISMPSTFQAIIDTINLAAGSTLRVDVNGWAQGNYVRVIDLRILNVPAGGIMVIWPEGTMLPFPKIAPGNNHFEMKSWDGGTTITIGQLWQ